MQQVDEGVCGRVGRVQINREEGRGGWRYMAASRRWWSREAGLEQRWVAPPGATFDQILKQGLEVDGGRQGMVR